MAQPSNPAVIEAPDPAAQVAIAVDPWTGLLHVSTAIAIDVSIVGLTVRELFRLEKGSIVVTGHPVGSNVPVQAGGSLIGWGEFQVVGDRLAVRVAELA